MYGLGAALASPHKVIEMPYHVFIANAFKPSSDASAAALARLLKHPRGYHQEHKPSSGS